MFDKYEVLKKVFHYDGFRPGQEQLIDALLSGRDVFGIMPTGGGKSLCYQVPALCLPGTALVVSPLIALIDDQVRALRKRGVRAEALHSGLSEGEKRRILQAAEEGQLKLLYLSPERLENESFLRVVSKLSLSLVCIDEAHCISKWGEGFRPAYRRIGTFIRKLEEDHASGQERTGRPPVIALTASASPEIREDIISVLGLSDPLIRVFGFDRPNLYFEVRETSDKIGEITELIRHYRGKCGIIYCLTRRTVEELTDLLKNRGFSALPYHAGLSKEVRDRNQAEWTEGCVPLMVATNAFGMGIDKADVRFVIHYSMPKDMENYYQEAGRAGRDGRPSDCILFYDFRDVLIHEAFFRREERDSSLLAHADAERKELRVMQAYASRRYCLRSFMLRHFGEEAGENCCFCSVCLSDRPVEPYPFGPSGTGLSDRKGKLKKSDSAGGEDGDLYTELLLLRKRLASRSRKLPYQIFSNDILHEMACVRPVTWPDFLLISGMTPLQAARYGRPFLAEIRQRVLTGPVRPGQQGIDGF